VGFVAQHPRQAGRHLQRGARVDPDALMASIISYGEHDPGVVVGDDPIPVGH
jgi:hypothetical protein